MACFLLMQPQLLLVSQRESCNINGKKGVIIEVVVVVVVVVV